MRDLIREVMTSMQSNKQRIALTGFSIGWGMFILVVLLGSAGGLQRGLFRTLHLDMPQRIILTSGNTSLPWKGMKTDRSIQLTLEHAKALSNQHFEHVLEVYPVFSQEAQISYQSEYVKTAVTGCIPGYVGVQYNRMVRGRDIDATDMEQERKVCVLTSRMSHEMFGTENPIGKRLSFDGLSYLVVGECTSLYANDNTLGAYAPLTTLMSVYSPKNPALSMMEVSFAGIEEVSESELLISRMRQFLSPLIGCSPADSKALVINNKFEGLMGMVKMLRYLAVFVWIIGIATLLAGIVGVSNIMLITVRERTRELGVRRAMGASQTSIISLVLIESVVITMIFGYIGMMLGIGLTQLLSAALGDVIPIFNNPTVQFGAVMGCNALMILAGVVAGYIPARRAISIKLVDALAS
ncbi:MAG: FtsX-like permease family protein [Prevotella sp.]|nr:FtsX-like permease family protein [Prevotella sp.]